MQLRPYQLEALEAVWNEIISNSTALCVMPTGSGKTEIIIGLLQKSIEIKKDLRVVVMMGRIDLVNQTEKRFKKSLGHNLVGVYCGSLQRRETSRPVTVASVASVNASLFGHIDMLIVDEVHRLDEKNGSYINFIDKAMEFNPKLKIVGFTATPFRANGIIYGDKSLFKKIAYKKTITEMIALGFLVEPKLKGSEHEFNVSQLRVRAGEYRNEDVALLVSDKDKVRSQVMDALARMPNRTSVVWATANIDHCNMVADILMEQGELATTVHSKLQRDVRNRNLAMFMGGGIKHMSFVTILSEGFDHPPIDCVVLMRPTRSPVLYVQTVGRGIRIYPEKKDCLILDYGQVVRTLGPLDDPKIKGKKEMPGEAVIKECLNCHSFVPGGCANCPECGNPFPPPPPVYDKLDKVSDHTAKILAEKEKPETIICGPATIEMYTSKAGNECVKITYMTTNIMNRWNKGISEYFSNASPWAMSRLEHRLRSIEAEIPSIPFDEIKEVPGTFEVTKIMDGKYDRILGVRKISNDSPEKEVKKTWAEKLDDNTSFDFGANIKGG